MRSCKSPVTHALLHILQVFFFFSFFLFNFTLAVLQQDLLVDWAVVVFQIYEQSKILATVLMQHTL